ncbi:GTP 3',8-cyclase MoaA [Pseudocnuella soli]|uniref:GTP 3',8-cyclase MoaA n=1 Tax=Pseudocnuella soli TaxID=2502779 RepID=UPI00104C2CDC|nr:GTP 3',8-cyclase MoaA [Pseudocnuella soli]
MIRDNHNRIHNYLRISLTDNCNLRCFYCMPEEEYDFTPASRLMQRGEIETLAKIFVSQGVNKIRLTGGEPLVRKDAADIILSLSRLPVQLTMTTNGTRLHQFIDVLEDAGVRSLNISLDTLQADRFAMITRRDGFQQVMDNIQMLLQKDFHVKVNVVVMKGLNDGELADFVQWTRDVPVHVRFIEFMPFSGNRWTSNKVVTLQQMLHTIGEQFDFIPLKGVAHDTAKGFMVPGHAGTFSVISTMSAHFCGDCNRMRLTADGKLKNCLFSQAETDLLTPLRHGADVLPLIHQSIAAKARQLGGQLPADFQNLQADTVQNRSMITIGG